MSALALYRFSSLTHAQYDYSKGQLPQLTEVIVKSGAKLFVCAVGVPPKEMVDKLHSAGIVVMKWVARSGFLDCSGAYDMILLAV